MKLFPYSSFVYKWLCPQHAWLEQLQNEGFFGDESPNDDSHSDDYDDHHHEHGDDHGDHGDHHGDHHSHDDTNTDEADKFDEAKRKAIIPDKTYTCI